jgi:hypothetical protein
VQRFIGVTTLPPGQETRRATLRPATCTREQIAVLRAMAREMAALSPQVEALGVSVQSGVIPYVYDFFDLADAMLTEGIRADGGSA